MSNAILVVDDDNDLRELLMDSLKLEKYQVFGAANGVEALKILDQEKINLVLTDFRMPKMNGAQMISEMMERHRQIPVIILISGFQDMSDEDAFDIGACAVMSKPMDMERLFKTIEQLIANTKEPWVLRAPRYESQVEIKLKMDGIDQSIQSKLFNVGKGGAFVQAPALSLPEVGHTAFFKIDFADITLSGVGVIRWVRPQTTPDFPSGYGLEFLFLDEPGRSQLRGLLAHMGRKQFIPKA